MKNAKKILALALVIVSVFAIALPALAEVWSSRYGDIELYTNSGDNHHIMNLQSDLNAYGTRQAFHPPACRVRRGTDRA